MQLEASDAQLETKGNVSVSYPYLGMGVAFVEMSEENVGRFHRLLATISRPTAIMGPGLASSLSASGPWDAAPRIADRGAALPALTEFFASRQMRVREDFLRLLRTSQSKPE